MASDDTEGFTECSHLDMDIVVGEVEMGHNTTSAFTEYSFTVGVININHSTVRLADFDDLVEGGNVAVHAEHAVGYDEDAVVGGFVFFGFVEDAAEVGDIGVFEDGAFGAGEADAIDDGAVVEFVADDEVAFAGELGDEAGVGGKAGLVDKAGFGTFELGEAFFKFYVKVHVARDWADATATNTVSFDGVDGGLFEFGVVA
jgi:hypothetical protein